MTDDFNPTSTTPSSHLNHTLVPPQPQESESREIKDLGGLWRFRADYTDRGILDSWQLAPLPEPTIQMPVPCSYNDVTQEQRLRDHVGLVWYQREFFPPNRWVEQRVFLFVGSAHHHATVIHSFSRTLSLCVCRSWCTLVGL